MLIFVILSITEAYFSKLSQSNHLCHNHSRALFYRLPIAPSPLISCSSSLQPYAPPKLSLHRPLLRPFQRATIFHPLLSRCPTFCPSFRPSCPSIISCPLKRPLLSSSSPGPPAVSPPQYYDDKKSANSNTSKFTSYLNDFSENSKNQLSDNNAYLTNDVNNKKSITNGTYHIYSLATLNNITNSKTTDLSSFNHSSDIYLSSILPIQQQLPQITTDNANDNKLIDEITKSAQKTSAKYLLKSNCSSNDNDNNCISDSFTMPPENDCCTNCSIPCHFRYIQRTSLTTDQLQEVDPMCNNELLRQIIAEQTDDDINKSKIRIERIARWFLGGLFGVICGNDNFAYIIQTKDFCQHRKGNVTCYAFRLLIDYNKINIP
ncbi:hypothetical protein WUBG_06874 [Wuchereria bancrofti]|uniref:Ground-like domain-containing protein n=2 Tax=Wuchereria bancrofti TaxID=6293 RepID=J9EYD9_WUCBA|nr:hypothetical protein WUBG_06874 [Wuchereria bancrofti]VDM07657.1 unnamed protein product [Wuchereria bancrofti]